MEEPQRDTLFHSSNFYLKINRAPGFSDAPDEIAVKAQIEINNEAIEYCDNLKVVVAGQELKLRNQQALQQIISFVDQNASSLIEFAVRDPFETIFPTQKGASSIEFKHYGLNLDFKYNFGTKNTEACDKFIDGIIKIIATEGDKDDWRGADFIETENEFQKYSKLYHDRFGKWPYLPANGGSTERVIEIIKTCLEKDEDKFDDLLFPDKNVLY